MDGIFGVGVLEIVVVALTILIIGGPKNAVKWSRELGRMLRQGREMWQAMMRELEKDLGEEGKEIMNTTRQLTRSVNEVRSAANPRKMVKDASRMLEDTVKESDAALKPVIDETDAALKGKPKPAGKSKDAKPQETKAAKETEDKEEAPPSEKVATNGKYSHWTSKE